MEKIALESQGFQVRFHYSGYPGTSGSFYPYIVHRGDFTEILEEKGISIPEGEYQPDALDSLSNKRFNIRVSDHSSTHTSIPYRIIYGNINYEVRILEWTGLHEFDPVDASDLIVLVTKFVESIKEEAVKIAKEAGL